VTLSAFVLALLLGAGAAPSPRVVAVTPEQYGPRVVAPHRGRVLVVNFWATWCEPCRREMPALQEAARRMARQGVDVVLVSADSEDGISTSVPKFLRDAGLSFPCFLQQSEDPAQFIDAVDPAWGGELPHTVVYSRSGRRILSLSSAQAEEDFVAAMRRGLAAD
jgi:thiol-disulfide isomerase/thioredoxin